jgi:hypothetical protein
MPTPWTRSGRAWVASCRRTGHTPVIAVAEQVGTATPELRELRLSLRDDFVKRSVRGILRLQDAGLASPDIDVNVTAEVLGAMLDYTCYLWFTLGKEFEEKSLLDTLTRIWAGGIGIDWQAGAVGERSRSTESGSETGGVT